MKAWHGCVLVGMFCHATRIKIPRTAVDLQGVDESEFCCTVVVTQFCRDAVTAERLLWSFLASNDDGRSARARRIEQAWWHEGKEGEADDGEASHGGKCIAKKREDIFAAVEKNEKDSDGDDEMGGAVIRIHKLQDPLIRKEQLLDGFLVVQPNCALEADDLHGIVERVQRDVIAFNANGPEAVAGERIDEIERPHDEDLFPPPRAVLADLVWHWG